MNKRIYALLFAAFLLASCSDKIPPQDSETTPPAAPETTAPVTEEEMFIPIQPAVPEDPVTVTQYTGHAQVHTVFLEGEDFRWFRMGEEYTLFVTFDYLTDKEGNPVMENGLRVRTNFQVHLLDNNSGTILDTQPLPYAENTPEHLAYTKYGECVLYREDGSVVTEMWRLQLPDEKLQIERIPPLDTLTLTEQLHLSSDGKWIAYRRAEDRGGRGSIVVRDSAGKETAILQNVMLEDIPDGDIGKVTGYHAAGFLDSENLLYNIGGWEWNKGWGICNVITGEKKEYLDGHRVTAIENGVIYGERSGYGGLDAAYILHPDGTAEELHTPPQYDEALYSTEQFTHGLRGGHWYLMPYGRESGAPDHLYIFSADMKTLETEAVLHDVSALRHVVAGENGVTIVLRGKTE